MPNVLRRFLAMTATYPLSTKQTRPSPLVRAPGKGGHGALVLVSGMARHEKRSDLTTKSDHNGMPYEAVWPDMWIGRSPGERQHRTDWSYLTSEGHELVRARLPGGSDQPPP
jgi:hypothetical protein